MIALEQANGFAVVTLPGELDMANIAPIEDALALAVNRRHHHRVPARCEFLDCSALRALVRRQNASKDRLVIIVPTESQSNASSTFPSCATVFVSSQPRGKLSSKRSSCAVCRPSFPHAG